MSGTHSNNPLSCPHRRIVTDIQGKIVEWGRRNVVSRRFHANDNKETIATRRLDLDRVLRVLDARHFARVENVANFWLQKEFSTNATTTVPAVRDEIVVTYSSVSSNRNSVANTPTSISDIFSDASKSSQDTGHCQALVVRTTNTTPTFVLLHLFAEARGVRDRSPGFITRISPILRPPAQ